MGMSPLTLQMTIPMTNDVSQIQNNENMRSATEHMQFAEQNAKQNQINRETVIQKDTAEFTDYRYDAKEKGNNEYQQNKKKRQRSASNESDNDQEEDGNNAVASDKKKHIVQIDIKL